MYLLKFATDKSRDAEAPSLAIKHDAEEAIDHISTTNSKLMKVKYSVISIEVYIAENYSQSLPAIPTPTHATPLLIYAPSTLQSRVVYQK